MSCNPHEALVIAGAVMVLCAMVFGGLELWDRRRRGRATARRSILMAKVETAYGTAPPEVSAQWRITPGTTPPASAESRRASIAAAARRAAGNDFAHTRRRRANPYARNTPDHGCWAVEYLAEWDRLTATSAGAEYGS